MNNMYCKNTANYPRLKTDCFFVDYHNRFFYNGVIDDSMKFVEKIQLLDVELWERFVQQFREDADFDAGWRGEFWGKMMRGACFVYSYTKNEKLYKILSDTVSDILKTADEDGRISSYAKSHEFDGWDLWGRKYVLLGMQYFLEICNDMEFSKRIIQSMCQQVDYIIDRIGSEDGKIEITSATRHWRGLNSCSILEPIVRLYSITKKARFLSFAEYIVNSGGTDIVNIFDLAYADELYPYQYPVTKAYEMTSCFEGLLEYYRITGEEKYKISIINYANKILESDFTVIGCCGCTHELFDHSAVRQANTTNYEIMQETCVTVTLMKFFYQLNLLTGNPKYVDAFETSLYNAYLGSLNSEGKTPFKMDELSDDNHKCIVEALPFDSYSPLTAGSRGNRVGGFKIMSDKHYYGCCACIGSVGIGLVPKLHILTTKNGFAINLFIDGRVETKSPKGMPVTFETKTEYPRCGKVIIIINPEIREDFEVLIRNPYWSKKTEILINGLKTDIQEGYISVKKIWEKGDIIEVNFDMRVEAIYPIPYGEQVLMNKVVWGHNYIIPTFDKEDPVACKHIALRRGPVMLAQDSRLGYSVETPISVKVNDDGFVDAEILQENEAPYSNIIVASIPLNDGKNMLVTDYSSAGKLWCKENKIAVWMLTI